MWNHDDSQSCLGAALEPRSIAACTAPEKDGGMRSSLDNALPGCSRLLWLHVFGTLLSQTQCRTLGEQRCSSNGRCNCC